MTIRGGHLCLTYHHRETGETLYLEPRGPSRWMVTGHKRRPTRFYTRELAEKVLDHEGFEHEEFDEGIFWKHVEAAHAWATRVTAPLGRMTQEERELRAFMSIFHPGLAADETAMRKLVAGLRAEQPTVARRVVDRERGVRH